MKRNALVVMISLALSACATPETRVRTALMDAGLSQPIAACMADRMVDRLSLIQLNKLNGLKKLRGQDMRKVTVEEFLRRTRALQDPEILGVATSSGLICAVRFS
jgi:type IV pilus biogenesis protein CpaD/CtpE